MDAMPDTLAPSMSRRTSRISADSPAATCPVDAAARDHCRDDDAPDHQPPDTNWVLDVLELSHAEILEREVDLRVDLLVDCFRDSDAAGVGDRLEPRCDVHAVAVHAVVLHERVSTPMVAMPTAEEMKSRGRARMIRQTQGGRRVIRWGRRC